MPTTRPFAYNTGSTIVGTLQVGDLAIGVDPLNYAGGVGGVQWWGGPDEDLGYVIAHPTPDGSQPNQLGIPAYLGFWRSEFLTEVSFIGLAEIVSNQHGSPQTFTTGDSAKTWLNDNGYWTSYNEITPIVYLDTGNNLSYSGSGSIWYDLEGVSNNATLINTPTYSSSYSGILSFDDASSEYATIPDIGDLNTWTVEVWFRLSSNLDGKVSSLVTNQYNLSTKLNFSVGTNNAPSSYNLVVGFFDGAWRNTTGFVPSLNTWYQVVGTYDGSVIRQYVNGFASGGTLNYVGTPASGGEVRLMRRWDSTVTSGNLIDGDLSIVKIYNTSLDSTQVLNNYNANAARFIDPTPTPTTTITPTVTVTPTITPTNTVTITPSTTPTITPSVTPDYGYIYYRWQITESKTSPPNANCVQSAEFVFQFDSVDQSMAGVTVTNPGGNNPLGEEPSKLVDGNLNTKALDLNFVSNGNITNFIFQFTSKRTFNGYRWATANDEESRDPKSWTIAGSNDGSNWTTLHTVTGFVASTTRNTYQTAQTYSPIPTPTPTTTASPTTTPTPTPTTTITPTITPTTTVTPTTTPTITPSITQTVTPTPTITPSPSTSVVFSQTFTSGVSPGSTIENAWTTFRGQLTGTYTKFDFTSSNGQGYTGITDAVKVQQIANALRTGTTGITFATTISGVTWNVGCCTCRAGGAINGAVEFANVALCSGSSTAALRPFINNSNWGGIGSTVGAATQTLTLRFY